MNSPRAARIATTLVPAAFAGLALLLGQDSNWDLLNYHLYNAYAYLNGKVDVDLAPAGTQSYFNPALDVAYWHLLTSAWPPLLGVVLGAIHGLHFVLLFAIARNVLAPLPTEDQYRVPLLLALAGCLTANFLAGLGNTMGDNITSLFQLGALLVLTSRADRLHEWRPRTAGLIVAAGVICGLGVGLKLTNAVYAVALCTALLVVGGAMKFRVQYAVAFGIGVIVGFLVTGGYWHLEMWRRFSNPLFPQFGALFPHPLAEPIGALDRRWLPHGVLEALAWPFVISYDALRVSELHLRQIVWGVWYALLIAWLARWMVRRGAIEPRPRLAPGTVLVLAFIVAAFAVWTTLFSVYRYVVPMETLLPLAIWILLGRLLPYERARRTAKWTIAACTAVVLLSGWKTWGHVRWETPAFEIEAPAFEAPASRTILVAEHPMAWLAVGFPPEVAFVGVLSSFPESPRYAERVRALIRERGGEPLLMLMERRNRRADTVERVNRLLGSWGVLASPAGCAALRWLLEKTRPHAAYESAGPGCRLGVLPGDRMDLEAANREALQKLAPRIERYGLALEAQDCRTYAARYGDARRPYRLCQVRLTD